VSRAREALEPHMRFILPPADLVEDLADKVRFAALAARLSLPVPPTQVVLRGRAARSALTEWSHFPCVLKPAMRTHWFDSPLVARTSGTNQKAVRIENRAELERLATLIEAHPGDFILQAAVEGGEERILSFHAYVRPGGHIVVEFTGKKIRTWPRRYGLSTYVEITDDTRVKELGRAIVERLGFSGVLKMDFKADARDERLFLLEINPRFSLWHHPATLAGACLPALYYRDAIEPGSARQTSAIRTGVRWMTARGDVHALSQYRAADELSVGGWLYELARTDVNEDFVLYDPWPGLVEMAGVAGRGLGRLLGDPALDSAGGKV
jgi:D-aspartate ligase